MLRHIKERVIIGRDKRMKKLLDGIYLSLINYILRGKALPYLLNGAPLRKAAVFLRLRYAI
jgi:hypothetical protein